MDDKKNCIAAYRLLIPEKILDIPDALGTDWVFRGQAKDKWDLNSSLEREFERLYELDPNNPEWTKWFKLLNYSDFETTTRDKRQSAPSDVPHDHISEDDSYSWLALLQHHGCKTRLVDFTHSFHIALYFAVREMPDSDAAVWAICRSALDEKVRSLSESHNLTAAEMSQTQVSRSISWPELYANDGSLALAYGTPEHPNERMKKQKGLFVIPLNVNRSFRENLSKGIGVDVDWEALKESGNEIGNWDAFRKAAGTAAVLKFIIPKKEHNRLLSDLAKMDISEATLFPGFDGFARSLNRYISEPE